MLSVVYDSDLKPLGRKRRRTKGEAGSEAGIERIAQTIEMALKDADIEAEQVAGIGIGCPGPLDLDEGVILEAPNLHWENVPVAASLRERFGCPVVMLNDVDAGVFGEFRGGAAQGAVAVRQYRPVCPGAHAGRAVRHHRDGAGQRAASAGTRRHVGWRPRLFPCATVPQEVEDE